MASSSWDSVGSGADDDDDNCGAVDEGDSRAENDVDRGADGGSGDDAVLLWDEETSERWRRLVSRRRHV